MDLNTLNRKFSKSHPHTIINDVLTFAQKPIITTNFGPYSATLLHAVVSSCPGIDVIWVDTGYNLPETYRFAKKLEQYLNLNLKIYSPKHTTAYTTATLGIPSYQDPLHSQFTEQVKLKPFRKAMDIHQPDVWFTNIRKEQSSYRSQLGMFSWSKTGVLKVSPFFYYSEQELNHYLLEHNLPNEKKYFDPTKQLSHRECGLHTKCI